MTLITLTLLLLPLSASFICPKVTRQSAPFFTKSSTIQSSNKDNEGTSANDNAPPPLLNEDRCFLFRNIETHQCYDLTTIAPSVQYSGRSYMLLALHFQRLDEHGLARAAFIEGVASFRTDAKLLQAWGLFESKQPGNKARAKKLLQRAVHLDPSLSGVLRWKIFVKD